MPCERGRLCSVLSAGGLSQVRQSRLQQLVDWCNSQSQFDGCLIFDECHKAKHFVPVSSRSVCVPYLLSVDVLLVCVFAG